MCYMSVESLGLPDEGEANRIMNVEWASDLLKKRGWKIARMPGSGLALSEGMYEVVNEKGEDTGIRFKPFVHTDQIHGTWYIQGRTPSADVYMGDIGWLGRGWEPFNDLDMAIEEREYYKTHGIDFTESLSAAAQRRKKK